MRFAVSYYKDMIASDIGRKGKSHISSGNWIFLFNSTGNQCDKLDTIDSCIQCYNQAKGILDVSQFEN